MAKLINAITAHPLVKIFRRTGHNGSDPRNWDFEPMPGEVVSDADRNGFCIIAAMNVISRTQVRPCYMDICLPERINDYIYFAAGNELRYDYRQRYEGEFIPAVAIDGLGDYSLFYSRTVPELGIEVLRRGLAVSGRKHFIAEDLGYILRGEGRQREAAEMFQLAADEGASSYFIYGELAEAYGRAGDKEKQREYAELFERAERRGALRSGPSHGRPTRDRPQTGR